MLMTSWLSLVRSDLDFPRSTRPDRPALRRDPWRNSRTSSRNDPFTPPAPVRLAARAGRGRPSEVRRIVRQRQF